MKPDETVRPVEDGPGEVTSIDRAPEQRNVANRTTAVDEGVSSCPRLFAS